MDYLTAVKTAIFVFPIIALLFTIPFIIIQYHKYGSVHKLRVLIIYSFILYLITAYFLVILPLPSFEEVAKLKTPTMNLIPFSFVVDFIRESPLVINNPGTYLKALIHPSFYVVAFNVFLTIPFGMYLRYYYKCSLRKTFLLTFFLSLFFELTQLTGLFYIYPRPYRLFDVDDLILNTLGGVVGYMIMGLFSKVLPSRQKIDEESIKMGTKVSGLRRITVFILDLVICLVICLMVSIFTRSNYVMPVTFIFYYVFVPVIWNGKTLGSNFLRVRFFSPKYMSLKLILRFVLLYLYYYKLPLWLLTFLISFNNKFAMESDLILIASLLVIFAIIMYYLITVFLLLKNGKIFYDKLLGLGCESTIVSEEESA